MPPSPVFLGFRAKQPWAPTPNWLQSGAAHVERVCSVADCLATPPAGWVDRWDFNRAGCYSTEAAALAAVPEDLRGRFEVFAYWMVAENVQNLFNPGLPPLPASTELGSYTVIGYDVAAPVPDSFGFDHSPLSCNQMAQEVAVNRYCLIDRLEDALDAARRFNAEQPEPGEYVVIQVASKGLLLP